MKIILHMYVYIYVYTHSLLITQLITLFSETFSRNPQYIITLKETDDGNPDKCTLVIGLMQKNRRSQYHLGKSNLVIGFYIFKVCIP